jgi:hypothetical protein
MTAISVLLAIFQTVFVWSRWHEIVLDAPVSLA